VNSNLVMHSQNFCRSLNMTSTWDCCSARLEFCSEMLWRAVAHVAETSGRLSIKWTWIVEASWRCTFFSMSSLSRAFLLHFVKCMWSQTGLPRGFCFSPTFVELILLYVQSIVLCSCKKSLFAGCPMYSCPDIVTAHYKVAAIRIIWRFVKRHSFFALLLAVSGRLWL